MKMWRQRLLSPILSPGKFAEYLVDEFNKINAVCSDSPGTEPTAAEVGELPSPVAKRADGVYDGACKFLIQVLITDFKTNVPTSYPSTPNPPRGY